jgi:hypothetical protein
MSLGAKMGAEVGRIRPQITALIGCSICALGIAIDAIGERYGFAAFEDWRCTKADCAVRAHGVPAEKLAEIRAVIAALDRPVASVAPAPAVAPDSRLPRERDDNDGDSPAPF